MISQTIQFNYARRNARVHVRPASGGRRGPPRPRGPRFPAGPPGPPGRAVRRGRPGPAPPGRRRRRRGGGGAPPGAVRRRLRPHSQRPAARARRGDRIGRRSGPTRLAVAGGHTTRCAARSRGAAGPRRAFDPRDARPDERRPAVEALVAGRGSDARRPAGSNNSTMATSNSSTREGNLPSLHHRRDRFAGAPAARAAAVLQSCGWPQWHALPPSPPTGKAWQSTRSVERRAGPGPLTPPPPLLPCRKEGPAWSRRSHPWPAWSPW
jgi:hypothetical protein